MKYPMKGSYFSEVIFYLLILGLQPPPPPKKKKKKKKKNSCKGAGGLKTVSYTSILHPWWKWAFTEGINEDQMLSKCELSLDLCFFSSAFNPFPNKSWFLWVCSTSLLKTPEEKEKLLVTSNFSFSQCFLPVWQTFCHFHRRLQTLSVWKGLKFVVWERVKMGIPQNISE